MKIGIDISQVVYQTGVSDYTVNLVSQLLRTASQEQFVLFGSSLRKQNMIKQIFPQAKTFPIPPTALHILWNKFHALNIENFTGPLDVFHSSDWTEPPASCPKVTSIHDLSPLLFPQEMSAVAGVHQAKLHWSVKECHKIICVSQSTAADAQKLLQLPSQKIVVIPEALPERFNQDPSPQMLSALKSKYSLSDYVIAIGTRQPRKNLPRLISAFQHYKGKCRLPEKLVIVGGSGWGNLMPENTPDVCFTGFLPDAELLALLSGAKAFVYPSLYEGFGLPVLLAFRQSIPVVASNISSLPEVAGDAAILVNPQSEEEIAVGMATAIKSSRRLVAAGKIQLRQFSWEKAAQQTLAVYKSIC